MAPFKFTMYRKSVFHTHSQIQIRKSLSRILLGDHKILTSRLVTFLPQLILKERFKTGISLLANVSAQWKTKHLTQIHNFTVLTSIMMVQRSLLLEVNLFWDFMTRSKEKNNSNLNNLMHLIIVIQIEFFVQNSTEIQNFNILFTVVGGIQHLLHGILELESRFKMYMDLLLEETVFQTVEWIF